MTWAFDKARPRGYAMHNNVKGGEEMNAMRAAVLQDLSCVGGVSSSIALPVLAAAGVHADLFPVAVYTSHTGFSGAKRFFQEELLPAAQEQCTALGLTFDLFLTGYLARADLAAQTASLIAATRSDRALLVTDPVMGDGGRLYSGLDGAYVRAVETLCAAADVILPNATEAALLLGRPYAEPADEQEAAALLRALADRFGCAVVLTGLDFGDGCVNVGVLEGERVEFFPQTRADIRLFGTGDLFASVLTAHLAHGKDVFAAAKAAGVFTAQCARDTALDPHRDPRLGVAYQQRLKELCTAFD